MNYLLYFVTGGALMALLKYTATVSDTLSGILGALPLLSGTFLLLTMVGGEKSVMEILSVSRGSAFGMGIGFIFYVAVCVALYCRCNSLHAFGLAAGISLTVLMISIFVKGLVT